MKWINNGKPLDGIVTGIKNLDICKVLRTTQLDLCLSSQLLQRLRQGESQVQGQPGQLGENLSQSKKAGAVSSVAESLPTMLEAWVQSQLHKTLTYIHECTHWTAQVQLGSASYRHDHGYSWLLPMFIKADACEHTYSDKSLHIYTYIHAHMCAYKHTHMLVTHTLFFLTMVFVIWCHHIL